MKKYYNMSNYGNDLEMTLEQASSCSHQGECDEDVKDLMKEKEIKEQLNSFTPESIKKELKETGAWSEEDLKDHQKNLERFLWISCCDIVENEKGE